MPPVYDKQLLAACTDVVIRYRGHGSYGSERHALEALARRVPGFGAHDYQAVFRLLVRIYDRAVHARARGYTTAACLRVLNRISPGYARREKAQILDWVVLWHFHK